MAKINTRTNITNAALELFSTQGYTDTTTRLIAEKAGVNEVTIFRHFGSKQKLFEEVTKNYVEQLDFADTVLKYKKYKPSEAVRLIGNEFINYCYDNEGIYRIQMKIQDDILSINKLQLSKSYIKGFTVYLNELKNDGIFKADPEISAINFVLSILGVFTYYVLADDYQKEYVHTLVQQQLDDFINNNNLE